MQFPNVKTCQYCDKVIQGEAWVSFAQRFTATLCSPQCKELYERASAKQGILPLPGWDVT